jgi:IS66 C-terminal element
MSDLYHWDVRLFPHLQMLKPTITAVVFLNRSMPSADLLTEIRFVRDFLPLAVFVLDANGDELERCRREAPAGGQTAAVLMSLCTTCKELEINPEAYVRDVLDRISTHPATRIEELLPDRWKALREASAAAKD